MKIIIKFEGSNEVFKKALNKEVNGFINQCLGKDNPYHGNFQGTVFHQCRAEE